MKRILSIVSVFLLISTMVFAGGNSEAASASNGSDGQNGQPKGGFQNYMTLKPFPQSFMDMLTDENNVQLDADAKKAYQNYGY